MSTRKRTNHVFAHEPASPMGVAIFRARLSTAGTCELSPLVRVRLKSLSPYSAAIPCAFTFPWSSEATLSQSLLPPATVHFSTSSSPSSVSSALSKHPVSPAQRPTCLTNYNLLVFDPKDGTLTLHLIYIDHAWTDRAVVPDSIPVVGGTSIWGQPPWLSCVELSTFSLSSKVLPWLIYFSYHFSFHALGEDYPAVTCSLHFNVLLSKIEVRKPIEHCDMIIGIGRAPSSFDEPLAAQLHPLNPSPPVLPMLPNGMPELGSKSLIQATLIRLIAAGVQGSMLESLGCIRRELRKARSPLLVTTRPHAMDHPSVPLEFDEEDEHLLLRDAGPLEVETGTNLISRSISASTCTETRASTSSGIATSATAIEPLPVEHGEGEQPWQGWGREDKQAVEVTERFDDITVGYVARTLMVSGVWTITFIPSARVSFSNPVRPLQFNYEDCLNVRKPTGWSATGHNLSIPMPGHPVPPASVEQAKKDVATLIDEHNAIFLMDLREAHWLPTVLGTAKAKVVLNARLGLDMFLVMPHGARKPDAELKRLGCYDCNDIVAPSDEEFRTLLEVFNYKEFLPELTGLKKMYEETQAVLKNDDLVDAEEDNF
ncbi:hypothetical protein GSI_09936 [Ganoderma sinense ZZ0214-1]|uniref:Uncharacterized protein n=1 Tax=Ganoderma sinense ZZ0214-1 TaxID=1077348 RepID=A0A2G8S2L5_9APHY|nr:hypothetical protein GSI_09936 [Ganoderma sinense ZZ0214-1]